MIIRKDKKISITIGYVTLEDKIVRERRRNRLDSSYICNFLMDVIDLYSIIEAYAEISNPFIKI